MTPTRHVAALMLLAPVLTLMGGCQTPPAALPKIERFLVGQCRILMTKQGVLDYQYTVQSPMGRGVFALAIDTDGRQACGASTVRDFYEWNELEVLAISRCESARSNAGIKAPCKVFAKNFEIVWDEKKKYNLE